MRGYDLQVLCSDDRWCFGMEIEKKLAKGVTENQTLSDVGMYEEHQHPAM